MQSKAMYASKKDIYTSLLSRPSQSIKQTTINISPKAYLHISLILHRSFSAFFYSMEEQTVVLIMGAGPAGLATAACLTKLSIPHVAVEREDCSASLWRNRAYDRLKLHLAKEFCELPHMSYQQMPQPTSQRISLWSTWTITLSILISNQSTILSLSHAHMTKVERAGSAWHVMWQHPWLLGT